jgi:hypothetical protein
MYERLFDFNKQRALFIEKTLFGAERGKVLQPEDLIQCQKEFLEIFVGFKEKRDLDGPVVDVFQEYTRSPGMPWGVSFVVYLVNHGIADLLSSVVEVSCPRPFPVTPYASDLDDLPKTNRPLAGDVVVCDGAWFVTKAGKNLTGTGVFKKGKKCGIYERVVDLNGDYFFIDMVKVYSDFIKKSGEITQERVLEFV